MAIRRFVAPLTVTAAVAAGGVAGAVLGVPALSGAQETTTTTPSAEAPGFPGGRGEMHLRGDGALEAAAEALGIERDALLTELRAGKTIAEVAADQSVDVDTVIDAMVADIVERTGRDEADVREHVTQIVNEGMPARPGHGMGHHGRMRGEGLEAAADALGMEPDDLFAALRDGKTIAEIADEQGVDVDTVIDAMVAEARERIETFVNEGPQRRRDGMPGGGTTEDTTADAEGTSF